MKNINNIMANLSLTIILVIFTGCKQYKEPIKIGINSWPPCELWYIAQENGYFGDTPVEIIRFSVWSDSMDSFYMGKTDITHSTYVNSVYYDSKGESAKIILSSGGINEGDGLVVKDYIKNISDLKGKKIAVEIGTDEQFLLFKVLENKGIEGKDIIIVPTDLKKGMDMFISNEVDAYFTYEPFLSQAADRGKGKIIATNNETLTYTDALVARSSVLQERKKDYTNIIRAWYMAQQFLKDNPEKAYKLMASKSGITFNEFKNFYEKFKFFTLEENKTLFSSKNLNNKLQKIKVFLMKYNLISNDVQIDELLDESIVNSLKDKL